MRGASSSEPTRLIARGVHRWTQHPEACAKALLWAADILSPLKAITWSHRTWRLVVAGESGIPLCDLRISHDVSAEATRIPIQGTTPAGSTLH